MAELSDRDRELLEFEAAHPKAGVAKDEAIRRSLGLTPTRYFQAISALLNRQATIEAFSALAKRLVRQRSVKSAARNSHSFRP
jgi:hypothetical protein